jgi:hypothetical protein
VKTAATSPWSRRTTSCNRRRSSVGGAPIPVDLLETQRRFDEANADCARLAETEDHDAYHAARQRRLAEVLALPEHPWLHEQTARGRRHQTDTALKHLVRSANG